MPPIEPINPNHELDREKVLAACAEVYTPEGVEVWMRNRNRVLDDRSPDDLILAGETQRVLDLLLALTEGVVL